MTKDGRYAENAGAFFGLAKDGGDAEPLSGILPIALGLLPSEMQKHFSALTMDDADAEHLSARP